MLLTPRDSAEAPASATNVSPHPADLAGFFVFSFGCFVDVAMIGSASSHSRCNGTSGFVTVTRALACSIALLRISDDDDIDRRARDGGAVFTPGGLSHGRCLPWYS